MVSSTFYDLKQIRADLASFIHDELGYTPLLSELDSFPVDPDADTIENCRRRIEQDADILVLIVGGRYGSVDRRCAKSITNIEYLAARAKGIPIYAFIHTAVIDLLPVWKNNLEANFSVAVDDPRVFEFIEQIRSEDHVWAFEFRSARDITVALKKQFAHLFLQRLKLTQKLQCCPDQNLAASLRGRTLRILLEKPGAWEYLLFAQTLIDEVDSYADLKRRYQLGIALGPSDDVPILDLQAWWRPRVAELWAIVSAVAKLVNEAARDAFGPPGTPGDPRAIVFVAREIGAAYGHAIEWSLRVRRSTGHEHLLPVLTAMASFPDDLIQTIEALGPQTQQKIQSAIEAPEGDSARKIVVMVNITLSNQDAFSKAMDTLRLNFDPLNESFGA
jgi:hypothetical protein